MKNDIGKLFVDELNDIYSAEEQIVNALPDVIKAAESTALKEALQSHLEETEGQIDRLKQIFVLIEGKRKKEVCKAMKGLIQECSKIIEDYPKSPVRDAGIISKAQRIEHYEISAYGTLRTFAKELDLEEVATLLQETLDEEANADKTLTKIAEGGLLSAGINRQANI